MPTVDLFVTRPVDFACPSRTAEIEQRTISGAREPDVIVGGTP